MSETKLPTILLIRHGETQWNIEGRLQGGQDAPLTLNGFRQICAVAENTRDIWMALSAAAAVSYITSPLGRAVRHPQFLRIAGAFRIRISNVTMPSRNAIMAHGKA